ncbi:MAG: phosphoribosylformylglycinamidine synthase subunit PurL, partial [Cyclobacteriaceae bacterium]
SATGKDGIHGAAFASKDITEDSVKDLPSVQVGDPFQEKLLLEATLEVIQSGTVVGMQDMGAAGIICSTSEMSEKGGHGMDIWLDKVPMRQENMLPWELLLSESQERMLLVAEKGSEDKVKAIFDKWDLRCENIGVVTKGPNLRFYVEDDLVADLPAESLVLGGGAPVYHREYKEPAYYAEYRKFDIASVPDLKNEEETKAVMTHLLSHPNIASRAWVAEQYDSMVGTDNTSTNEPCDAPIVRIKGTDKALSITVDCNSRYVNADPEEGAAIAVSEAARNIVCSGGEPVAVTNCLNFGNPYVPEVYWQFVGAIKGMIKSCEKFDTPVTGGNVSFYNQSSDEGPVFPTPTIGMLGLLNNIADKMTLNFKNEGDLIYLAGPVKEDIASSEYLYSYRKEKKSPAPAFDLDEEYNVQQGIRKVIADKLVESVHDVSDGGLFVALAESAMSGHLGFAVRMDGNIRKDAYLFGEAQSRAVLSVSPDKQNAIEAAMKESGMAFRLIGKVTKGSFTIDDHTYLDTEEALKLYNKALPELFN